MIEDAIPRNSSYCVFAEAVKAAYPGATRVAVDLQTIRFTDPKKGLRFTYLTPRPCQVAIINFDQGIRPDSFSIQLRNGQVTPAASNSKPKIATAAATPTSARKKKALENARAARAKLRKQTLVIRDTPGAVPDVVGGKTPPIAPGRRRSFGLRALDR